MQEMPEPPRLLIADDSEESLRLLHDVLTAAGFEVMVANDGEAVLELVRGEVPNLILLDMVMPRIDGIETCRRLKSDAATSDVPVIFLTAHDEMRHKIHAFQAGGVDYISKPIEEAELLVRVRTHLSIRTLTQHLRRQNQLLQEKIQQLAAAQEERERAEVSRAALQAQIIASQKERLVELSTPLIPITDRVVVMPLIGALDAERAQQAMETALHGAASRGAEFVIIDITGLRSVDASVADLLVRTSDGLRLLGARAMVTGISPDVAQALVRMETGFGALVTKGTLQDGIAAALRLAASSARSTRAPRRR